LAVNVDSDISRTAETETVRAFVAIHLPAELLAALHELQMQLEAKLPQKTVRWTSSEQLHLTLQFLGNIPVQELGNLEAALQNACGTIGPIQLRAEGLGGFPNLRNPRVIWVGLERDLKPLAQLQFQIHRASAPWCERPEERGFQPHLTLGRVRENASRAARRIGEEIAATSAGELGEWCIERFYLMQSKLTPKGAVHTVLNSWPLEKNPDGKG
jgi:2'-5' RNA ligase